MSQSQELITASKAARIATAMGYPSDRQKIWRWMMQGYCGRNRQQKLTVYDIGGTKYIKLSEWLAILSTPMHAPRTTPLQDFDRRSQEQKELDQDLRKV